MMKRFLILIAALLFVGQAHAQGLSNLPPNTIVGRLGAGVPGPAQAIPFATLGLGIVTAGPSTPVAGLTAATDYFWGAVAATTNLTNEAVIWPAPLVVRNGFGFAKICNNSDSSDSPCNTMFDYAGANNTSQNVTAITTDCNVLIAGGSCWGGNSVARDNGVAGAKLVGWEFDIAPSAGNSPSSSSIGVAINISGHQLNGPGIFLNTISSGAATNGFIIGGTYSATLFAVAVGTTANIGIDLSQGTYSSSSAIKIANSSANQVNFNSTAGNPASLYNDSSNNFTVLAGNNNLIKLGNNAATAFPFQFNTSTDALTLGVSGTTAGSVVFNNATSGTIKIAPTTGALSSGTLTLPNTTDTFAVLGTFAAPPAIGNTTPAAGSFTTLSTTGVFTAESGNTSAPSINFGDAGTGFYKNNTNVVGFTTNGTTAWLFWNDGSFLPNADNSFKIGNTSNRVSAVYSMGYFAGASNLAGVSTVCTVTASDSLTFTLGLLTTKGAHCT